LQRDQLCVVSYAIEERNSGGAHETYGFSSIWSYRIFLLGEVISLKVHAQQQPLPVVGYLSFTSPDERPTLVSAFREGLAQADFVAGQNVTIEYRSAGGKYEQLPILAAGLVKIPAAVIVATGGEVVARAAKMATSNIPIVFTASADAIKVGLVASLNRPGGNITGVSLLSYELDAKRLQLLRELLPHASTIGLLVNANNPSIMATVPNMNAAAEGMVRSLLFWTLELKLTSTQHLHHYALKELKLC
jgi:putative ABC transport system substrate-binding protein